MAKAILSSRYNSEDIDTVLEIGFDEAGRGCFFGPIMAGAVIWPREENWTEEIRELAQKVRDSKKLSPVRRKQYAKDIQRLIRHWGVGVVSADEINVNGIQWANREAFRRALGEIQLKLTDNEKVGKEFRLLVDGEISFCQTDGVELNINWNEEVLVVEGDGHFLSIGAASILAKVAHDDWIENWIEANTEIAGRYDMKGSKGYGTSSHREGLGKWGAVEGHRTLFIRRWVPESAGQIQDNKKNKEHRAFSKFQRFISEADEKCLIRV